MAKKTDKIATVRRMAPAGSKTGNKSTNHKTTAKQPVVGKSIARPGAKTYPPKAGAPVANLLAVRIVAGVLGALCLAGGIAVGVTQAANMAPNLIVTMVLLGLITAFAAFTAIKPAMVAGWFAKLSR